MCGCFRYLFGVLEVMVVRGFVVEFCCVCRGVIFKVMFFVCVVT